MFELRAVVELHVSGNAPAAVVLYLPNVARAIDGVRVITVAIGWT